MKRSFYIVFSDLKGFSKLIEEEITIFQEKVLVKLKEEIKKEKEKSAVWNTWGDAVFTAFEDGKVAADFMIKYRDFFNKFDPDFYLNPNDQSIPSTVRGEMKETEVTNPFDPNR